MAFINFDCPECGHNLEVDERGAGFIVKCPECNEPIQIPDMPSETSGFRRHARTIAAVAVRLVGIWINSGEAGRTGRKAGAAPKRAQRVASCGKSALPAIRPESHIPKGRGRCFRRVLLRFR